MDGRVVRVETIYFDKANIIEDSGTSQIKHSNSQDIVIISLI